MPDNVGQGMLRQLARASRAAACGSVLLATACSAGLDAPVLDVLDVEMETPHALVRTVHVVLGAPAPVTVEYWTEGSVHMAVEAAAAAAPTLVLTGLEPARAYHYRVLGSSAEGVFTTDRLPADLEAVGLESTGTLSIPFVLLHLHDQSGFRGYAAVDGRGRVRWYWRTEDLPYGMTRRDNGDFVFMDRGRGLVEVAPSGVVVHELARDLARGAMHHDVIATPANTLLFIAFDTRDHDGAPLAGESIWEWWPESGEVAERWSAWDALDPDADRGPRFGSEWMHANALALGLHGNVLLSVHFFDQILSIAPDWRSLEWRLGGVGATLPVSDDERFSGQHAVREIAPDTILMFDNGIERGARSRLAEYAIGGDSARLVRAWEPDPPNFASAVGSARRLPDGNTLVGFGMSAGRSGSSGPVEVYEVSPSGAVLWHLVVRNTELMFRAEPLASIGAERQVSGTTTR